MNDSDLLRRPLSPANRRVSYTVDAGHRRLVFGIDRVRHLRCRFEAFASEYGKNKAPSPAAQDLPPWDGLVMGKVALIFFYCMGLRPLD